MTPKDPIDQRLERLGAALTPPAAFQEDVMGRIDPLSLPGRHRRWRARRILMKSSIGIAACLAIALAAWLILSAVGGDPLYAQVIEAVGKARTVHLVGRQLENGTWTKEMEAFYERGVGVAEYGYRRDGKTELRIDNGKHCWRRTGDGPVVQSKSADLLGIIEKLFRMTVEGLTSREYTRDPTGDRAVDGVKCRLYVRQRPGGSDRRRIWIDLEGRMRRWEEHRSAEQGWETCGEVTVQYDVPIDPSHFQPPVAPAATVLNAGGLLEEQFGLENAIFIKEVMGLAFAVHDIRRCDNGMIFAACSLRPLPETVRKLGAIRSETMGDTVYGDFQLDTSWKRVDGKERSYQPISLGTAYQDGLQIQWVLLHPLGDWPKETPTCELSAYVHTRGKLQQQRQQAGEKWWRRYRPLTVLPLPEEAIPLKRIIAGVYSQAVMLEPLAGPVYLNEAARPGKDGMWSSRCRRPSEMTPEEFLGQVLLEFEGLELRRQEWKRKAEAAKAGG